MSGVFESVIGQPQAIELLTCAMQRDRLAPAYLFMGPAGVGRRLTVECFAAWILAKDETQIQFQRIAQRNHPDLLWVEPTYQHKGKLLTVAQAEEEGLKRKARPQIRLEQIREIGQFLSRPSLEAKRAVVVLEATETMAEAAANGLLKTLEEPGNATLILLAPNAESLLPTLISRCQRIPFRRLSSADLTVVLQRAEHAEILQAPDVLALAQGSPGEAIAHWQKLQSIPAELLTDLSHPPTSLRSALEYAAKINRNLDTESQLWLVEYLQHRYWHTQRHSAWLHSLETVRKQLLNYAQPRLVWEVALMKMVAL
ncbi:DNA polymerase III subunit delta' [Vacuolonema iberomarrocanum]|uniref:DNA polymerase III subunit delta' n=1 Tax=Vacuolonema iberomarrocanum TaxID=3454632 RepID=UPI0019F3C4A1|nr:DNA polymerase III subunit delta' [filamentous cyanobacterium LEGE 07170]